METQKNVKKGFTLVELLVIIAIIGLLAGVITPAVSNARVKALDARKIADAKSIQTAVNLYYENTGAMPINRIPGIGYPDTYPNFLQELVDTGLLSTNPKAPAGGIHPYYYYDYGPSNTIGALVVTNLEGSAPSTNGYPGTCRPWPPDVNWCDQDSNTWYCLCNPY